MSPDCQSPRSRMCRRPMPSHGWIKQRGRNFAVSLEHRTFFRSADEAVNSSRFIAFYFRQKQTSNSPDFKDFPALGEFFRRIDMVPLRKTRHSRTRDTGLHASHRNPVRFVMARSSPVEAPPLRPHYQWPPWSSSRGKPYLCHENGAVRDVLRPSALSHGAKSRHSFVPS